MEFRNLTPFPVIAFESLDQRDQGFHTVVMRLTFDIDSTGELTLSSSQTPLVTTDEFFGSPNASSVLQESDLAPYKPHTDVAVLANAYAPSGQPQMRFRAGIRIHGAATDPDLPPEPYGLNPTQRASADQISEWESECQKLRKEAAMGPLVLEKIVQVTGPREWRKTNSLVRALSLFTMPAWSLTEPKPITSVPLRYEYAYGGENKILVTERSAHRVPNDRRLPDRVPQRGTPEALAAREAVAHTVCPYNPIGRGFAEDWYVKATLARSLPAPQIEALDEPVMKFGREYAPCGLGLVGRAWKSRLPLAGTFDDKWLEQRHPYLPADFDFAYWNGAPADQQVVPHLDGDETISLINLTPPTDRTTVDAAGDVLFKIRLPGHLPFVLVRFEDGRIGELPAKLDTVAINLLDDVVTAGKAPSVVCVWRATVATVPPVRVLEARMIASEDVAALRESGAIALSCPTPQTVAPEPVSTNS
ncbi:DUF2169 family type VI secretion system accessory protein [Pseudoduganella armeniaca]|uniref:DUF2169 domain-containing protein n=1 Tax=Pseudoduganella armeniaca TaxID=2072590 RepID=A0A2R4C419_9BURK|nr:DUF2169 domain-containing protein [Pseudoduganella armeniaca]AVR94357.1 DUF2169 domain-containing protein [Pseudoduganella armeniaca]